MMISPASQSERQQQKTNKKTRVPANVIDVAVEPIKKEALCFTRATGHTLYTTTVPQRTRIELTSVPKRPDTETYRPL